MKKEIIVVKNNKGYVGTKTIADGFKRRHDFLLKLINKYKSEFELMTNLKSVITKGKTKSFHEYLLNEEQFLYLAMLMKNSDIVRAFKRKVSIEFVKIRDAFNSLKQEKATIEYQEARQLSKVYRRAETDVIKEFIEYAKEQGGSEKGCEMYYANITRMMNQKLFVFKGDYKNIRNYINTLQLFTVGTAEQIIKKTLEDGMKNNVFYREIYKDLKRKMDLFIELHGQSEVVENTKQLEEK